MYERTVKPAVASLARPRPGSAARWFGLALGFVLGAALVPAGVAAQGVPLSVEFRSGICAEPGEAVARVPGDSVDGASEGSFPAPLGAVIEAFDAAVVERVTLAASLVEIAADDHVIDVRSGDGSPSDDLACGELAAFESLGPDVQVGLSEQNGSGHSGVAWLHDNGDGTTAVAIVVAPPAEVAPADAPVGITIAKSSYDPNPIEIAVGTTITWTNEDLLPHTVTDVDFTFDSGYMAQGDVWSRTFETPGTFSYFCVYHPRMRGAVIVS
jgi:plastocyanin